MELRTPSLDKKKKDTSSKPKNSNEKSRQISTKLLPAYDISLIDALESDHEQILELYNKALHAAENQEYTILQLLLVEFATLFTNHIQVEDDKFYGYLKILAKQKSSVEHKVVTDFASEMKNISISIFTFLSQSPHIPVNENTIDAFTEEFSQIGAQLLDRIEREEQILYPIYKSSRKVVNISQ